MKQTLATKQDVKNRFYKFISFRNKFSIYLSLIIIVCYYAFVCGMGFVPEVLGYRLGPSSITLGIMAGIFLIALSIVSTGIYTLFANKYFDKEQGEIIEEMEKVGLIEEFQKTKTQA